MPAALWASLSASFPRSDVRWRIAEVADDLGSARLERVVSAAAITARLDATVGRERWSCQLLPLGARALVCNLVVDGVGRSGVADTVPHAPALPAGELADLAFAAAAAAFGMVAGEDRHDPVWVEFDAETGEALFLPHDEPTDPWPEGAGDAAAVTGEAVDAADTAPLVEARPAGHEVIERLVDRLREEGLGKEAARLLVAHGGYGRSKADSRELYGKLRALLLERAAGPAATAGAAAGA